MKEIEELATLTDRPFNIYRATRCSYDFCNHMAHWNFRIQFPPEGDEYFPEVVVFRDNSLKKLVAKAKKYLLERKNG